MNKLETCFESFDAYLRGLISINDGVPDALFRVTHEHEGDNIDCYKSISYHLIMTYNSSTGNRIGFVYDNHLKVVRLVFDDETSKIRLPLDCTEEHFFQQSLVEDFNDVTYEVLRKFISLSDAYKMHLESKGY